MTGIGESRPPQSGVPRASTPEWISYSWWHYLSRCPMSAAFRSDPAFRSLNRPSTYSVLGQIRHDIAELIGQGGADNPGQPSGVWFDRQWERLVDAAAGALTKAWQPAAVPPPRKWPNYEYVKASVRRASLIQIDQRRATPNLTDLARRNPPPAPVDQRSSTPQVRTNPPFSRGELNERWFIDKDRGWHGQLDRVRVDQDGVTVTDLKSGVGVDAADLVDRHRLQLLFYAGLVQAAWDVWPQLEIISVDNRSVPVPYESKDVEALRRQVATDVAMYSAGNEDGPLAYPSVESCAYCPFQVACSPLDESWNSLFTGENPDPRNPSLSLVVGVVRERSSSGAVVVSQDVDLSCPAGDIVLTGIPPEVDAQPGDLLAVAGVKPLSDRTARIPWTATMRVTRSGLAAGQRRVDDSDLSSTSPPSSSLSY